MEGPGILYMGVVDFRGKWASYLLRPTVFWRERGTFRGFKPSVQPLDWSPYLTKQGQVELIRFVAPA